MYLEEPVFHKTFPFPDSRGVQLCNKIASSRHTALSKSIMQRRKNERRERNSEFHHRLFAQKVVSKSNAYCLLLASDGSEYRGRDTVQAFSERSVIAEAYELIAGQFL
jgi:hypothetical protein